MILYATGNSDTLAVDRAQLLGKPQPYATVPAQVGRKIQDSWSC